MWETIERGLRGKQDLKNHVEGAAFLAEEITFGEKVISVKLARWRKVCACEREHVCVCVRAFVYVMFK